MAGRSRIRRLDVAERTLNADGTTRARGTLIGTADGGRSRGIGMAGDDESSIVLVSVGRMEGRIAYARQCQCVWLYGMFAHGLQCECMHGLFCMASVWVFRALPLGTTRVGWSRSWKLTKPSRYVCMRVRSLLHWGWQEGRTEGLVFSKYEF